MGGLACPLEARYGGPLSTLIGPDMGGLASPLGPFKRGAWLALWAPDIGGLIGSLLFLTGPCDGGAYRALLWGPSLLKWVPTAPFPGSKWDHIETLPRTLERAPLHFLALPWSRNDTYRSPLLVHLNIPSFMGP